MRYTESKLGEGTRLAIEAAGMENDAAIVVLALALAGPSICPHGRNVLIPAWIINDAREILEKSGIDWPWAKANADKARAEANAYVLRDRT